MAAIGSRAEAVPEPGAGAPRVVALGGGHGLYASLSALRLLTPQLTAVVTVADDGGSSGRLREQFDVLPPGDLRMALSALCDDSAWGHLWREAMQHRFSTLPGSSGELDGHAMGNLLLLSLWQLLDDPVAGLDWASQLLKARGRVLPMAVDPLVVSGWVRDQQGASRRITGQARLATAERVERISLEPAEARACPEALEAIRAADWLVLGPGSWYTSVIPHLLLPELREAICSSAARVCVCMNLAMERRETAGLGAVGHLEVLERYAPGLQIDVVVADPSALSDPQGFDAAVRERGARLVSQSLRRRRGEDVHSHLRLAAAYQEAMGLPEEPVLSPPAAPHD